MTEFFSTLFDGWQSWDAGQWSLVVAVLTLLGLDGVRGGRFVRWVFRGFKPAPEQIAKVEVVQPASASPPQAFPRIVPPPKERELVAREDELLRIRSILESRHGVQITGQQGVALNAEGGRGKTALAREYAERFADTYDGGWWLRAQSRLELLSDLGALGTAAFDLPLPEPVTEAHGKVVLQKIIDSCGRWLLVYDNLEDHADIQALICDAGNVDVIITTRLAQGLASFGRIDVNVLGFDTPNSGAVDLLLQEGRLAQVSDADRAIARDVAEDLGGLPLALVMGGALIREDGWSLEKLRDEVAEVLRVVPENSAYPDSVAGAVLLTYRRLDPDAQMLANICAWLAPSGLSEDLFLAAVDDPSWSDAFGADVFEDARQMLEDPARLRAAMRGLKRWSVLTGKAQLEMHRLTQAVLRAEQRGADRDFDVARAAASVLAAQSTGKASLVVNWEKFRALTPHVQTLWAVADPLWSGTWSKPDWAVIDHLLNSTGIFLSKQADLEGAVAAKRASLALKQIRLAETDRNIPLVMGNLAVALADTGALAQAQALIDDAVRLDVEHRKGDERSDLATSYMQAASIAFRRMRAGGDIADGAEHAAEDALSRAAEIRTDLFGENSAPMSHYWNELGYLRRLQRRAIDSFNACKKGYEITKSLPDTDAAVLATQAMNVGSTALQIGLADKALALLTEAYTLQAQAYAAVPSHPEFQKTIHWLIACHLVHDRKAVKGAREAAVALCTKHGVDLAQIEELAAKLPLGPIPLD
ncbi:MAG: hypothetical protein AAF727_06915 [Pseudomonadota bacterium]